MDVEGTVFDHAHYVPILRWKIGERRAVRSLFQSDKARMTPLFEWSRPGEVAAEEDRQVPTPAPRTLLEDIMRDWGPRPFFFDPYWFWSDSLNQDSASLRRYAVELASGGLRPIPVTRLNDGTLYRSALSPLTSDRGICVRLTYTDLVQPALSKRLSAFMSETGFSATTLHVVADFEMHYQDLDIAALCGQLASVSQYRTFTVATGSFPMDLREFKGPQVFYLPRDEWSGWHTQAVGNLPRRPTFGDYATLHPILTRGGKGLNPSASIRYTTADHWLVMKGEGLRNEDGPGYEQYPANAKLLMQRRDYCGPEFSAGDRYIRDVASSGEGTGNPTTWVQAGVNHHLTFVVRQLEEFWREAHEVGGAVARAAGPTAAGPTAAGSDTGRLRSDRLHTRGDHRTRRP